MPGTAINAQEFERLREGSATNTDAFGNPAPTLDPATLPEGTWFTATAYAAGIEGDMEFQVQGGAWVWKKGGYWGSNSNGKYTRRADGTQECWFESSIDLADDFRVRTESNITGYIANLTWTFPVAFIDSNSSVHGNFKGTAGTNSNNTINGTHYESVTTLNAGFRIWGAFDVHTINQRSYYAIGRWK